MGWLRDTSAAVASAARHLRGALAKAFSRGEAAFAGLLAPGGAWGASGGWQLSKAEQVRHYKGWAYVAISAIAAELARHTPRAAYLRRPEHRAAASPAARKRYLGWPARHKALAAAVQPHEELELVDSDHPLLELLTSPNPYHTTYQFWFLTAALLECAGEMYWWAVPNKARRAVVELWPLFPHWVTPYPGSDRLIDHYVVQPGAYGSGGGPGGFALPPEEVIAFRYPSTLSLVHGHAPMLAGGEWIDTDEAVSASKLYFFENGVVPSFIVSADPRAGGVAKLATDPEIARIEAKFAEKLQGRDKHRRMLFLNPGMTATPATQTAVEMDFTRSAEQTRDWVLGLYRVSKHIAGITDDVNRASAVQATSDFLHRTIAPKHCLIDQTITQFLARPFFGEDLRVFHEDLAPEDPADVNANVQTDQAALAITPNEVRAIRGREPYPKGGDNPVGPGGVELPWVTEATGGLGPEDLLAEPAGAGEGGEGGGGKSKGLEFEALPAGRLAAHAPGRNGAARAGAVP